MRRLCNQKHEQFARAIVIGGRPPKKGSIACQVVVDSNPPSPTGNSTFLLPWPE
jgi:hypothetical protein